MRAFKCNRCLGCLTVFGAFMLLATTVGAGDDTARFYGTWKTTATINGQTVSIVSVHDASGYRNVLKMPTGDVPVAGTFHAADGNWSSNTPYPYNSGTYRFQDNDHVVQTNAAGEMLTWVRDKTAKAPTTANSSTATNKATGFVAPNGCRTLIIRANSPRPTRQRSMARESFG